MTASRSKGSCTDPAHRRHSEKLCFGIAAARPEPVTSVDVTACDTVAELDEALHAQGIELFFAELKDPVKDKLKRFGLFAQLGEEGFFPTLGAAVSNYLKVNNVAWEDWEDQVRP